MKLGMGEILVVLLIALLVLGPEQLPAYARKLGNALRAFRDAASETTEGIRENIIEPLNEAQQPLRDALEPVEEMQQEIERNVKDVEKSFKEVTSPVTSKKPAGKGTDAGKSETPDTGETTAEDEQAAEQKTPEEPAAGAEPGQQPETEGKDSTL